MKVGTLATLVLAAALAPMGLSVDPSAPGAVASAAPSAGAPACELSARSTISFMRKMSPAFVSASETKIVIATMDELSSVLDMKRLMERKKAATEAEKRKMFSPAAEQEALGCIATEKELMLAQRKIGDNLLQALTMQKEQFCGMGTGASGVCEAYTNSMAGKVMAGSCHGDPRVDGGKVKQCTPALKTMAQSSFIDAQKKGYNGVAKKLDYSHLHAGFFSAASALEKTKATDITKTLSVPLFMGTVRKMTIPEHAADSGVRLMREQAVCQKKGHRAIGELHEEMNAKIAFYAGVISDLNDLFTTCAATLAASG